MEYETEDADAQARFDQEIAQRVEHFRAELDIRAKGDGVLAAAAGLDAAEIPPEALAELEQAAEHVSKAEPPPLPRE